MEETKPIKEEVQTPSNEKLIMPIKKKKIDNTLLLPVLSRLKKRIKQIQEMSQAKISKIPMGNTFVFETEAPQIFISNFQATVDKTGTGLISYQVFKKDRDGNKDIRYTYSEKLDKHGNKVKIPIDATYIIEKLVIERIPHLKPIEVEELKHNA